MKKKTKILSLLIVLVLICCSGVTVNAASYANAKAHAALKRQLKADKQRYYQYSSSKMRYVYVDINGDHIDELITEPGYGYLTQAIYSYKNRTVKTVAAVGQGTFTKYYPKHKVIYIKNSGHMGYLCDYYYKQSKTGVYKLVAQVGKDYGSRSYDSKPIKTTYYIGNKKTSKAKYSQYIKKMLKGEKGKNFSSLKWKRY
ncbi:hypothetical protein LIQ13_02670 [Blautia luti]|uniref:hypothetical protein n=1 Tax=Blautia luti TaxID=89014 RepID=UPI001D02ABA4|nr:hypothetical protein [Blautia luti]MCB5473638.1 hypothetical protein [Blautia luti]